ncbi:L,D-transpeptidase family protein [Streptomyces sp. NPDC054802]
MPVTKSAGSTLAAAVCAALLLTGCTDTSSVSPASPAPQAPAKSPARHAGPGPHKPSVRHIPGLGPDFRSRIPGGTRQALVVSGGTADTNVAETTLYENGSEGGKGDDWRRVAGPWPAHNALRGWTHDHNAGDLRTPIGVFGLGDAGGLEPDPGTRLPYDQDEEFVAPGTGFLGEPLEGSFDYVIAIDYNRVPGTSPLDKERPLGPEKGSGLWIHVDHEGPTQGCISLPRERMRELLRLLDPDKRPVVVMGPAPELRK